MILKRLLLLFILLPVPAWADFWEDAWLDPALVQADSLDGGSGFIHVPAPQSLPDGMLTASVHQFKAAVGRGFPYGIEAGWQVELDGWNLANLAWNWNLAKDYASNPEDPTATKENLFYARWSPLKQDAHCPIGVSMGWEGVGMQDLGFRITPLPSLADLERHYIVAGGTLPGLPMIYVAGGYGGGEQASAGFGEVTFAPFAGMACIAEYNERYTNVGVRVLLSTQIKLDLDVSEIQTMQRKAPFADVLQNNVSFGVSYSEMWP